MDAIIEDGGGRGDRSLSLNLEMYLTKKFLSLINNNDKKKSNKIYS